MSRFRLYLINIQLENFECSANMLHFVHSTTPFEIFSCSYAIFQKLFKLSTCLFSVSNYTLQNFMCLVPLLDIWHCITFLMHKFGNILKDHLSIIQASHHHSLVYLNFTSCVINIKGTAPSIYCIHLFVLEEAEQAHMSFEEENSSMPI